MEKSFEKPQHAKDCLAVRLGLGHPDEVHPDYAITIDEFNKIIGGTFKFGKKEGNKIGMMGTYLPLPNKNGMLLSFGVSAMSLGANTSTNADLHWGCFKLAFDYTKELEG